MTVLAAVGIISVFFILVIAVLYVLGHVSTVFGANSGQAAPKSTSRRIFPIRKSADTQKLRQEEASVLKSFHEHYKDLYVKLDIPRDAQIIVKCTCVFSLNNVRLRHYFWQKDDVLYFFPVWESIYLALIDESSILAGSEDADRIYAWKIPVAHVGHYFLTADCDMLSLFFTDSQNRKYKTVLLDNAADILKQLFPDKDGEHIMRKRYYGSAESLSGIKSELGALESEYRAGAIDTRAYEKRKNDIIRGY